MIIPSNFVNKNSNSLMTSDYLLDEKLSFNEIEFPIWGCQLSFNDNEIKVLLSNCGIDNVPEFCMIVQMKNSPTYGLYLVYNDLIDDENNFDNEPIIAVNTEKSNWFVCNTYLQATFLSGIEYLKDVNFMWRKCTNYKDQINLLKSFALFHNNYFSEEEDERKED
jgi:hypothetical protein